MKKTIWKFAVEVHDEFVVEMPKGARLLSVQTQSAYPFFWAVVDPEAPRVRRAFALRGTGHDAKGLEAAAFVGTFQLDDGALVFHLFDRGEVQS